jgi:hypothetical protein
LGAAAFFAEATVTSTRDARAGATLGRGKSITAGATIATGTIGK